MTDPLETPDEKPKPDIPPVVVNSPLPKIVRIRRETLLVGGVLAALLGSVVLVWGFRDNRTTRRVDHDDSDLVRQREPSEIIRALPRDYSFTGVETPATTQPTSAPGTISAEELAAREWAKRMADLRYQRLVKEQKELDEALDSPLIFPNVSSGLPSAAMGAAPPGRDVLEIRAEPGLPLSARRNLQSEKEAFLTQGAKVEPYLQKPLLNPISRYELQAGSVIPGALITAINTDLPGQVIGQVTQNVYDSVSGRFLLIPQGTRILGRYSSLVSNGQDRALIVWNRLIMPNGNSIVLDGMPGTDQTGAAGLHDQVDIHPGSLITAVTLSTAIAYGGNLARSKNGRGNDNGDVVGDTVAQQAGRIGDRFVDKAMDIQPTITIRPGWPFLVAVSRDIVLAPYQNP